MLEIIELLIKREEPEGFRDSRTPKLNKPYKIIERHIKILKDIKAQKVPAAIFYGSFAEIDG